MVESSHCVIVVLIMVLENLLPRCHYEKMFAIDCEGCRCILARMLVAYSVLDTDRRKALHSSAHPIPKRAHEPCANPTQSKDADDFLNIRNVDRQYFDRHSSPDHVELWCALRHDQI